MTFSTTRGAVRWLAALVLLLAVGLACGQNWEHSSDGLAPVPPLRERVTDLTSTLSATETQALVDKLAAWEQKTGNQLAVLVVPSTQPEPIEAYSIRVADAWKIGRKGQDNGALLVVAKNDRKIRIEVGYGFEGVLTDATSRRIISDTIAPLFRQNQFAQGINAGVDQIIAVVDKGTPLADKPPPSKPASRGITGFPIEMLLIIVFVVVPILGSILRRIFGAALGSTVGAGIIGAGAWVVAGSILIAVIAGIVALVVMLFSGVGGTGLSRRGGGVWIPSGGGGWGGGGSSGGGGGGFSGGGGSFGGGGASGSW
jgi:uncharacterized protein